MKFDESFDVASAIAEEEWDRLREQLRRGRMGLSVQMAGGKIVGTSLVGIPTNYTSWVEQFATWDFDLVLSAVP